MPLSRYQLLKEIYQDPDRKPIIRMFQDLIYLSFIYKEFPRHYFSRYLYKKETTEIKNFMPNKILSRVAAFFNDRKFTEVTDNKLYFDLFYRQFNISLPKLLMYNHKRLFIIGNMSFEVNNISDFILLLEKVFEMNSPCDSIFIKKTYASSIGTNTFKLFLYQFREDHKIVEKIYSGIINSEFLFQETVRQHPELDKLTPASLNTIRFDTFMDCNGKIDIISGYLRMSTTNNHVDSNMLGGVGVGINMISGKLKKAGFSKARISGVKILTQHPITGTKFENFTIPFFDQAKQLVIEAARYIPAIRVVGWDVAISETGPVLIEGNSDYGINASDMMDGGYLANGPFQKVLGEIHFRN